MSTGFNVWIRNLQIVWNHEQNLFVDFHIGINLNIYFKHAEHVHHHKHQFLGNLRGRVCTADYLGNPELSSCPYQIGTLPKFLETPYLYIAITISISNILNTSTIINITINLWETSGGGGVALLTVLEILNHPAASWPSKIATLPYPLETSDSMDDTLHFSGLQ